MIRYVKMNGGSHELEMFTKGNNYFVIDGVISDDAGQKHSVYGSELVQYTTGHSFYVYTKDEVKDLLSAHEDEADGLPTNKQALHSGLLLSVISSMGGW